MAYVKEPVPGTRGFRVDQIRAALDLTREAFAEELARVAAKHGLDTGGQWTLSRVSRVALGRQPISLDDAATIVELAREKGLTDYGWDWFVHGRERKPGKFLPRPMPHAAESKKRA